MVLPSETGFIASI